MENSTSKYFLFVILLNFVYVANGGVYAEGLYLLYFILLDSTGFQKRCGFHHFGLHALSIDAQQHYFGLGDSNYLDDGECVVRESCTKVTEESLVSAEIPDQISEAQKLSVAAAPSVEPDYCIIEPNVSPKNKKKRRRSKKKANDVVESNVSSAAESDIAPVPVSVSVPVPDVTVWNTPFDDHLQIFSFDNTITCVAPAPPLRQAPARFNLKYSEFSYFQNRMSTILGKSPRYT